MELRMAAHDALAGHRDPATATPGAEAVAGSLGKKCR